MTGRDVIEAISEVRASSGLSAQDVADRMGVTRARVLRLEREDREPTVATLIRYGRAVGIRVRLTAEYPSGRVLAEVGGR